jgi:hypothetical protein
MAPPLEVDQALLGNLPEQAWLCTPNHISMGNWLEHGHVHCTPHDHISFSEHHHVSYIISSLSNCPEYSHVPCIEHDRVPHNIVS